MHGEQFFPCFVIQDAKEQMIHYQQFAHTVTKPTGFFHVSENGQIFIN